MSPEAVGPFFANGMLLTILMSMGLMDEPEPWAESADRREQGGDPG